METSDRDGSEREISLAAMLATGSADFGEILLPLLTSDEQQIRLSTYRSWGDFHLATLGSEWQEIVSSWPEDVRAEFVSEMIHFGNAARAMTPFALSDPSQRVRVAAISALPWAVSREAVADVLRDLNQETFEAVLEELPAQAIPASARSRAVAVYRKFYAESSDPVHRLQLLLHTEELGATEIAGGLKEELAKCGAEQVKQLSSHQLKPALEMLRAADPHWVSNWVAERIADNVLWHEHWVTYVKSIPDGLSERLLVPLEKEDLQNARFGGGISVLAASADATLVQRVFARLCELRRIIAGDPDGRHEFEWTIERQLEDLFRLIPAKVAIEGLLPLIFGDVDAVEMMVVSGLFSRVGRENSELRKDLDPSLREKLRDYLRRCVPTMLKEEDFSGKYKANLASALARVGEPEDIILMRELIQSDIRRVRTGREAWAKGDRGRQGNGAVMSYAVWHMRALVSLDPGSADKLLLELMEVPEYEREAANALVQLAHPPRLENPFGRRKDYGEIWESRAKQPSSRGDEAQRKRYAKAIRRQIEQIMKEGAESGKINDYRLKELTKTLAAIDGVPSKDFIFSALAVSGRFNGWQIVGTLEILLRSGVRLPAEITLKLFDTILEQVSPNIYNDQEGGLLVQALCVLPFIDKPPDGIARIRAVIAELKIPSYKLRDLAWALGNSQCNEALDALRELAGDATHLKSIEDSWVNAVAALDSPQARQLLLSFVDPGISGLPFEAKFDREDIIGARLIELARRDKKIEERLITLCSEELPPLKRSLLARVVGGFGTNEALLAALNLIDDKAHPPVPREVWEQIERTFVERRPYGSDSNAYTQAPRSSNEVRMRLFEMSVKDARRMKSATAILWQIQLWRLEYGRPNDEPRSPEVELESSWSTVEAKHLQPDSAKAG